MTEATSASFKVKSPSLSLKFIDLFADLDHKEANTSIFLV